jgi:hypothetical protein
MEFPLDPLTVECQNCHAIAETYDYQHPDRAVTCRCCPVQHDHAGIGCRPVMITATARLMLFDIQELMEMAAARDRALFISEEVTT